DKRVTNNMKSTLGIKKFWSMIKIFMPAKWLLILAMVLVIIETCLSLAVPLVTKKFIDGMTLDQISTKIIAVLICVFVTQLIMSGLALYTMNFVGQSVVLALREKTWQQILHLPISFFDRHPSGETMSRMTNDTLIIKEFITGQLIP
ncbi:multidrug ABC transporter permease, partial [Bacillus cereus]